MKSVSPPSSMTFGGLFNNMAYSAEESSPLPRNTESCCVCDQEFSSDIDLADHLVSHADEEVFKIGLQELEKKTPTKLPPMNSTPIITRTVSLSKDSLKRTASQRSTSPEVWEIISDDSDDESNKNKKSAKTSNSFRLVSTPTKSAETVQLQSNQSNKFSTSQINRQLVNSKLPVKQSNKTAVNNFSKTPVNNFSKTPVNNFSETPVNNSSKTPVNHSNIISAKNAVRLPVVNHTNDPPARKPNKPVNTNLPNKPKQTFKCHTCSAEFQDINILKEHVLTHEKEKTYTCHICKKAFLHKGSLRQHLHLHIGDKSHSCKICNKKFTVKSVLRKHELEEHSQPAPQTTQTRRQKST